MVGRYFFFYLEIKDFLNSLNIQNFQKKQNKINKNSNDF